MSKLLLWWRSLQCNHVNVHRHIRDDGTIVMYCTDCGLLSEERDETKN